jgi:hypothetical protein
MVILRIYKKYFDRILSGEKKTEWRSCSDYNYRIFMNKNPETNKFEAKTDITEILFINGYEKDSPKMVVEVLKVLPRKFKDDYVNKFGELVGKKDEMLIRIALGQIISTENLK